MERNYNKVMNIFDGNSIRVDFNAGSDDLVVFSFSGFKSFKEVNPRYGEKIFEEPWCLCSILYSKAGSLVAEPRNGRGYFAGKRNNKSY